MGAQGNEPQGMGCPWAQCKAGWLCGALAVGTAGVWLGRDVDKVLPDSCCPSGGGKELGPVGPFPGGADRGTEAPGTSASGGGEAAGKPVGLAPEGVFQESL